VHFADDSDFDAGPTVVRGFLLLVFPAQDCDPPLATDAFEFFVFRSCAVGPSSLNFRAATR